MIDNYNKYANLLLSKCLNIKEGEPLLIQAPIENIDFVRIVAKRAYELGVNDIYFDFDDDILKHDQLLSLDVESLKKSRFWNKKIFDEYANKGAAFLMLYGDNPDLTNDIDPIKVGEVAKVNRLSRPIYKAKQSINEVSWCIASVATEAWARKIFPNSINPKSELWNKIFEMCLINSENPLIEWDKKVAINSKRCELLNNNVFKELHYTNSLGTDLLIKLSDDAIWCGGDEETVDGRKVIMNMPTEEVFTTPIMTGTSGVVYSSKPLVYSGALIENFMLKFEDGKVVGFEAEKGYEVLKSIIEGDEHSCMLGEVALVDYNSPISNSGLIFYETLFDENASCHLAFGNGFPTCIKNTSGKSREDLIKMGINQSSVHVDFMIGTKDLTIKGINKDNEEVLIFDNGNFILR